MISYLKNKYQRLKLKLYWRSQIKPVLQRFNVNGPRIIYAITPPETLSNIGDQAQVVAIYDWFKKFFPQHQIIEIDKNEVIYLLKYFKSFIKKEDLIVLHSGGNLGDRGIWSETSRRMMISNFSHNKIISLPQTINFRDTEVGQKELAMSKKIYNAHKDLIVVGRDHQSFELAKKYFKHCKITEAPDFVLSYTWRPKENIKTNGKALFCLREDDESAISAEQRKSLLSQSDLDYDLFDTTISEPIDKKTRKEILDKTLEMFSQYEYIVTDRFHGLIFAILAKKPTVVLPTVDHKLTSAFDWFDEVKFVKFAPTISEVNQLIKEVKNISDRSVTNWDKKFFEPMSKMLN